MDLFVIFIVIFSDMYKVYFDNIDFPFILLSPLPSKWSLL